MQNIPQPKEPGGKAPGVPQSSPSFLNKSSEVLRSEILRRKEKLFTSFGVPGKTVEEIAKILSGKELVGSIVEKDDAKKIRQVLLRIEKGVPCSDPELNKTAKEIEEKIGGEIKPKEVVRFLREELGL